MTPNERAIATLSSCIKNKIGELIIHPDKDGWTGRIATNFGYTMSFVIKVEERPEHSDSLSDSSQSASP